MLEDLKNEFMQICINWGGVGLDDARSLWDEYGEAYIEDLEEAKDNLIWNIIKRSKL